MVNNYLEEALAMHETLSGWRRHLHQIPEIGLDLPLGRLLAVDWSRGPGRPPIVMHLYDGGVLTERRLGLIRLQESELLSWRMVPRTRLAEFLPPQLAARVTAALDVLDRGEGTVELEDGVLPRGTEG